MTHRENPEDMSREQFVSLSDRQTPFPLDRIPGSAGNMAEEIARMSTCQNDALSGAVILGVISAAIGAALEMESGPEHTVRGNLHILGIAESGTGKSEVFKYACRPLIDLDTAARKRWIEIEEPSIRARLANARRREKILLNPARGTIQPPLDELVAVSTEIAQLERLLAGPPCAIVGDATKEKLADLAAAQPLEALASMSAEARGIFQVVKGRYSGSNDFDFYCSGYSGDTIVIDRIKNSGRTILTRPCLTLTWLAQPDIAINALRSEEMTSSGFLARFLAFDSHATPQVRSVESEGLTDETRSGWRTLIESLFAMRTAGYVDILELSPEARGALFNYREENIRLRTNVELGQFHRYIARWHENACRLAVVLHAAQHAQDSGAFCLSLETAQSAIRLMRWFAGRQLHLILSAERSFAGSLREKLKATLYSRGGSCSLRDLARILSSQVDGIMEIVRRFPDEFSWVTSQGANGGRPSTMISLVTN